jgi:mRNA interferase RelE/StbE
VAKYRVLIKTSAAKELEKLPKKDRATVAKRIMALGDDPRPPGCQKLSGDEKYRIRQGTYRILYTVEDDGVVVVVVKIGHRRDVYR